MVLQMILGNMTDISPSGEEHAGDNRNDEAEEEDVSAWRRDSESSFSDWTIRVVPSSEDDTDHPNRSADVEETINDDNDSQQQKVPDGCDDHGGAVGVDTTEPEPAVYHVHRVYLASGPRKSEYFQTLFSLSADTEESRSKTTELVLPESACAVFPRFLDYVYGGWSKAEESSHKIDSFRCETTTTDREEVALAFLADYLRVPKLIAATKGRIRRILRDSNIHVVCREALMYQIDWIVDECIRIAAKSPRDLVMGTPASTPSRSETASALDSKPSSPSSSLPPALQTMKLLPPEKQTELLRLSLSNSLNELERFKRVPSQWKKNIDDVAATHMPTLMMRKESTEENYRLPVQGCGLPFPNNKICPLFYFDREPLPSSAQSSSSSSSSPLAPSGFHGPEPVQFSMPSPSFPVPDPPVFGRSSTVNGRLTYLDRYGRPALG